MENNRPKEKYTETREEKREEGEERREETTKKRKSFWCVFVIFFSEV